MMYFRIKLVLKPTSINFSFPSVVSERCAESTRMVHVLGLNVSLNDGKWCSKIYFHQTRHKMERRILQLQLQSRGTRPFVVSSLTFIVQSLQPFVYREISNITHLEVSYDIFIYIYIYIFELYQLVH